MRASEGQELSDGGGGAERGPALKRREVFDDLARSESLDFSTAREEEEHCDRWSH